MWLQNADLRSSFSYAFCFLPWSFAELYAINVDLSCFSSFLMACEVFCSTMLSISMNKTGERLFYLELS